MGNTFIEFFRSRVSREEKRAFLSAFIAGLLVHIYKFSNTLPNSDSLYNFYDPQNIVASGGGSFPSPARRAAFSICRG